MNRFINVLIMTTVSLAAPVWLAGQDAPAAGAITLRQAAELALRHNPELQGAAHDTEAARAGVRQARSFYLPRLDLRETFTNGNNPVYVFGSLLTQRAFSASNFALDALNLPNPLNNLKTELTVYQSLWEGGKVQVGVNLARLNEDIKARELELARQNVLYEVATRYFAVQLARESIQTTQAALRSAEANRQRIQDMAESGLVVASDLLRMQVYEADMRRLSLEAENKLLLSQAALDTVLGRVLGAGFEAATPLRPPGEEPAEEAVYQAAALRNRPEVLKMHTAVEAGQAKIRQARGDYFPGVGVFGTWEYDQGTGADRAGHNYIVGVQLRWNVFDGYAKAAKVGEAKAQAAALESRQQSLVNQIALQVKEGWLHLRTARNQHTVAMAAVGQAEEARRIVRNRYESGLSTITDLLSAEAALTGAKMNLSQAAYNYFVARSGLELASGRLTIDSDLFN